NWPTASAASASGKYREESSTRKAVANGAESADYNGTANYGDSGNYGECYCEPQQTGAGARGTVAANAARDGENQAAAGSEGAAAQVSPVDTPAAVQFHGWLDAFNSGDRGKL